VLIAVGTPGYNEPCSLRSLNLGKIVKVVTGEYEYDHEIYSIWKAGSAVN